MCFRECCGKRTAMAKFIRCSLLFVFVWNCNVGGINNTGASTQDNPGCIPVICQNGTATMKLNESIVEKCKVIGRGLYDETGHFLREADQSGLMKLSCQPSDARQVTWKIRCVNKMMDEEVCFRIEGRAEEVPSEPRDMSASWDSCWWCRGSVRLVIILGKPGSEQDRERNGGKGAGTSKNPTEAMSELSVLMTVAVAIALAVAVAVIVIFILILGVVALIKYYTYKSGKYSLL